MKKLAIALLLSGAMSAATAAELMLYDIPLSGATRAEFKQAVTRAGGRLLPPMKNGVDVYDVSRVKGLPDVKKVTGVFYEDTFVMAQFEVSSDVAVNERTRKMLLEKYGPPGQKDVTFSHDNSPLTGQYPDNGRYIWNFDNKMALVYKHEFLGPCYLTYVSKVQEAKLSAAVNAADDRAAKKAAGERSSAF